MLIEDSLHPYAYPSSMGNCLARSSFNVPEITVHHLQSKYLIITNETTPMSLKIFILFICYFPVFKLQIRQEKKRMQQFIKCRIVKTSTQKKMQNREKGQTLRTRFGKLEVNLKKLKHGFFFQLGQLDNPETVFRYSWQFGRNFRVFGAHFLLPREKKQNFQLNEQTLI